MGIFQLNDKGDTQMDLVAAKNGRQVSRGPRNCLCRTTSLSFYVGYMGTPYVPTKITNS